MHPHAITAPGFRRWKTWGPVFNTMFFAGVGVWYVKAVWGFLPYLDGIVIVLLIGVLCQTWWVAIVLKQVEIDGDNLRISGLRTSVTVPRSNVLDVKDRSNLKRMPSVIVLRSPIKFGTRIRFFPSMPVEEAVAQLKNHLVPNKD